MIKINKQPKAMRWNFCSYFEQIANPPNFLRKLALEFCLRQKSLKLRHSSNWAANLFKIWQNSNASLSVAYLFFIIYQKFNFFYLLLMNTKIISQSPLTYTKSYRRTILPVLFPFILCYNKKD